jgi:TolB-like protein
VVQWGIVYAAGAWGVLQGLEYVTNTFDWPRQIQQLATLALLFLVGGGIFWRDDRANDVPSPATASLEQPGVASGMTAVVSDNSIAVLPFINMSGDPDNEYFSDGISEEILNVLAGTPQLKVAARTSSFSFKGKPMEVPEIAAALKVRMVLEGSVRRQADTVRITAQLIAAQTGFHIWSQTYDRKLEDIFAIQDEIVRAIHSVRAPVAAARDRLRRVVFPLHRPQSAAIAVNGSQDRPDARQSTRPVRCIPSPRSRFPRCSASTASPARGHQSCGWNPATPARQSTNAYSSPRSSSTCERVEPTP